MIRQMNEKDIPILRVMSGKDLFLSRILSNYNAYGNTDLAQFWVQVDKDTLNAVFCRVDNVLTLAHLSDGNMDEMAGFLYAVDASEMLCSPEFAEKIHPNTAVSGPILYLLLREHKSCDFEFNCNPPLREIYEVMAQCKSPTFRVPDWEPFYLDMSHRIRHQCAVSVGIRDKKGKLCACGFSVSQTEHNAILGGICVLPQLRRKGYGTKVVQALLSQLPQNDIYVFRDQNENVEFYSSLGFADHGTWAELAI